METEEENELIEHKIEIDEYVSATLRIPKVLTAIELKALMIKANKLFNLADVPLAAGGSPRRYVRNSLGDEQKKALIKEYDGVNSVGKERIAERLGINGKALYQKVWTLKKQFDM